MSVTNVANFSDYKKKFDSAVIYVGDRIEWQDFDGQTYEGVVTRLEHKPVDGYSFYSPVASFPLWEKEDYVLYLEGGTSIVGDIVVRKIVRKAGGKKFVPAGGAHVYAN